MEKGHILDEVDDDLGEKFIWQQQQHQAHSSGHQGEWRNVTPDFTRKTECISYVRQDQFTHT
jgi:hypothetical protein